MTRSAVAFVALLILPGIVQAQEPQPSATHDVVDGETLWALALRYYDNPFLWPRIYQANRGVVEDPHWIYPGEMLVIPDVAATVEQVVVVAPEQAAPTVAPAPIEVAGPRPGPDERTVFWRRGQGGGFVANDVRRLLPVVSRDVFYSAPWLVAEGTGPVVLGTVGELMGAEKDRRRTYFRYDVVQVLSGQPLPVGTMLQAYRMIGEIEGVGDVARPSGVLTVIEDADGGAVAVVADEFARVTPGDLLRPLPDYRVTPGIQPSAVAAGPVAAIVGFAQPQAVQGLFDVAFLGRGSSAGVRVGDEYVLLWSEGPDWPPTVEGRLQVVAVEPDHASARIVALRNPVFETGLRVVLDRKMP